MWVTAAVALFLLLLGLCVALREAVSVERRLQRVLQAQSQRLADLQQKLTQLHAAPAQMKMGSGFREDDGVKQG